MKSGTPRELSKKSNAGSNLAGVNQPTPIGPDQKCDQHKDVAAGGRWMGADTKIKR